MMEQKYKYFPLYVKMEDVHIVIFGAGTIAARRAAALAKTPCRLTVIAPECGDVFLLSDSIVQEQLAAPGTNAAFICFAFLMLS